MCQYYKYFTLPLEISNYTFIFYQRGPFERFLSTLLSLDILTVRELLPPPLNYKSWLYRTQCVVRKLTKVQYCLIKISGIAEGTIRKLTISAGTYNRLDCMRHKQEITLARNEHRLRFFHMCGTITTTFDAVHFHIISIVAYLV